MSDDRVERRLTTILAADVVGYSRLMAADEAGTLAQLKTHRKELIGPKTAEFGGRVVKLMGDGTLMEFTSVVDAVNFAVDVQQAMAERNAKVPEDQRITYRIGINIGDIIVEGDDIYGDGVNVAARLEASAEPGGICVSRTVFDHVRGKAEVSFEDLGAQKVKNIPEPVQVYSVQTKAKDVTATPKIWRRVWLSPAIAAFTAALALTGAVALWQPWKRQAETLTIERPSGLPAIAVLPFDNISGDPEQEYFSDGITEDLITDLSRVSGLFVIARNSVFTYKGTPVKVQQVGRELGVAYVLEGSVRKAGDRVRINAQLVDASTGRHLWADRYDRNLTNVFTLQDEVVQKIVSAMAVRLTEGEEARLGRSAKVDSEAYDLLLRGLARFRRFTREDNAAAREFFERAIALDSRFARAHADLAWSHALDSAIGWTDNHEASLQLAIDHARDALALDESVPQVHIALAMIYRRQQRFDASIAEARRTIELDPNFADGYALLANSLIYGGHPDAAVKAIATAMRLNPRNPFFFSYILGHAKFLQGHYEDAAVELESALERNPHFLLGRLALAATYGQLGLINDAEWQALEILTLQPDFSLTQARERQVYLRPVDQERFIEGLQKAGLPE